MKKAPKKQKNRKPNRNKWKNTGKEEEIEIPGYSLAYGNDRSANSGAILIGVRDNTKNISLELTQENKVGQSLWIVLTNTKKKLE